MSNRSNFPIELDEKQLDLSFPVSCQYYTQQYQAHSSLHYHGCMELGRCLKGSGVQFIGGETYPFSGNALTILQKSCVHDSHIIMLDPGIWRPWALRSLCSTDFWLRTRAFAGCMS